MVERLERGVSDHCPQLIRLDNVSPQRGLFKFYNVLADHDQFEQLVSENWCISKTRSTLRDIWKKCHKLKGPLKQLNTKWFMKTSEKVDGIRQKLHLTQQLIQQEASTELF